MGPDIADGAEDVEPRTRILIVDDHAVSRAALRALLRTEGFDVADVGTQDAPMSAAVTFRPAVAVVDVTPEHAAGFRVAGQLASLPDPPAVVLTSSAGRTRFGSRLDRHLFVAKADLCGDAIMKLALCYGPTGRSRARQHR